LRPLWIETPVMVRLHSAAPNKRHRRPAHRAKRERGEAKVSPLFLPKGRRSTGEISCGVWAYSAGILGRAMYLRNLREYAEAKNFWIGTVLGLIGLVVAFAAAKGLLWISAAVALSFMGVYPIVNTKNRWHLYSPGEKRFNVGLNVFFSGYLIYIIASGLATKGAEKVFAAFGMVGIAIVAIFILFLLHVRVPQWGKSRKECPMCFTTTEVAAKACAGCGYRWPAEATQPEQGSAAATAP